MKIDFQIRKNLSLNFLGGKNTKCQFSISINFEYVLFFYQPSEEKGAEATSADRMRVWPTFSGERR